MWRTLSERLNEQELIYNKNVHNDTLHLVLHFGKASALLLLPETSCSAEQKQLPCGRARTIMLHGFTGDNSLLNQSDHIITAF